MRTRFAIKLHAIAERYLPERRLFLRSETDTRFIRLRSSTQAMVLGTSALVVAWSILATAILLMDSIGSGNLRDQARRDLETYQVRLNILSEERDARAAEAIAAQERFNTALDQVSVMQSKLLEADTRKMELEAALDAVQVTLRDAIRSREALRGEVAALRAEGATGATPQEAAPESDMMMVDFLSAALARTAQERDQVRADAQDALVRAEDMALEIKLMQEKNDSIFSQLEDAMQVSVAPLDRMFEAAGMNPERILSQIRSNYSGQGGPLTPLSFSTRGEEPSADVLRVNGILNQMDRLNLYRLAAEKLPFASPLRGGYRFTSGFGMRWGRMHTGTDFAGPHGSPIYATADGVVTYSGWKPGYGRIVILQHAFGMETRYAHNSKHYVSVGQRVSRGDRIAAMGNTGRSTGTHLHYEVRVGGEPVNPMIYIKAANDVFKK